MLSLPCFEGRYETCLGHVILFERPFGQLLVTCLTCHETCGPTLTWDAELQQFTTKHGQFIEASWSPAVQKAASTS